MKSFNHVTLFGNLTRDPERIVLQPSGDTHVEAGIAMNREYFSNRKQAYETEVTFVELEIIGKGAADFVMNCLKKGDSLLIGGALKYLEWEDKKTGQKRSTLKVTVREIIQPPLSKRHQETQQ